MPGTLAAPGHCSPLRSPYPLLLTPYSLLLTSYSLLLTSYSLSFDCPKLIIFWPYCTFMGSSFVANFCALAEMSR